MVEKASLNFCFLNINNNNNYDDNRKKNRFFYLDSSFKLIIFSIFKFKSVKFFYSRKTLKRLRYLKSLNSKAKPR